MNSQRLNRVQTLGTILILTGMYLADKRNSQVS